MTHETKPDSSMTKPTSPIPDGLNWRCAIEPCPSAGQWQRATRSAAEAYRDHVQREHGGRF